MMAWSGNITVEGWRRFLGHDFSNPTRRAAYDIIEKAVHSMKDPIICEVGFGQCFDFRHFFKSLVDSGHVRYVGIDTTRQFVEYAKDEFPGYSFEVGTFLTLPQRAFEIGYTRHTFEHQCDMEWEASIRRFLGSVKECAVIVWFIKPTDHEIIQFLQNQGFNGAGAWVNQYSYAKVRDIVLSEGFHFAVTEFRKNDAIYVCRRTKSR